MDKQNESLEIENRERKIMYVWVAVAIISLIGAVYGFYDFDIDSFDGAMIFISTALFITSIICIFMFKKRAEDVDMAIKNKKYIVHFKYTEKEWAEFLEYEHKFRLEEKKVIFYMLTSMTIIIFAMFILVIDDARIPMFSVMVLLVFIYTFMAFILPHIMYYFRKISKTNVIIMEKGILLHKKYHTWDFPLSKLVGVEIEEEPFHHLKIAYEFWEKAGPRTYIVNVPIPKGNKVDLKDVIKKLKDANMDDKRSPKKNTDKKKKD